MTCVIGANQSIRLNFIKHSLNTISSFYLSIFNLILKIKFGAALSTFK